MPQKKRPPIIRATDILGIPNAFRAEPLSADDMEFYVDSLDKRRKNNLQRGVKNDLLESAAQKLFLKAVLFGNRGNGKSTEINRLLIDKEIKQKFIVVRLDALNQLNPRTFGMADVLILLVISLIVRCNEKCNESGRAFHEAGIMENDLVKELSPFFPELQNKMQEGGMTGGSVELNILSMLKFGYRSENQVKIDFAQERRSLENLLDFLVRKIGIVKEHLPEFEILIVGENFDKEQISPRLLDETFVQYSAVFRQLPIHFLFTLPVPFVNSKELELPFDRDRLYPIYDIPVCDKSHKQDTEGITALTALMEKRADLKAIFADDALELLLRASGGDLFLLFTMIVAAGKDARYRHEDEPTSEKRVVRLDVENAAQRQLGNFRNRMGTVPGDSDQTTWETKRLKLRAIYEGKVSTKVPDDALYQLLRRRAVLFFNGPGRYGVHPLAVEMLREEFATDPTFSYKGSGLDL